MLSYKTAIQIPTPEAILILDSIYSRDKIIDTLLDQINTKYNNLAATTAEKDEEIKKLKKIIEGYSRGNFISGYPSSQPTSQHISHPTSQQISPHLPQQLSPQLSMITEATRKGYMICRPISNRNIINVNMFNQIMNILSQPGKKVILDRHNAIKINDDELLNVDTTDKINYDYGIFNKKKKFLSGLIGIATDYVSENVYVEKVLQRLDKIVDELNKNEEIINLIFNGRIKSNQKGEIAIIFKGGNVYKLFTQVLDRQLDSNIFQNYLNDVDRYFKKSDCDFGILFIIKSKDDREEPTVLHLERNTENETLISTIQYIILNKYRNDFLGEGGYEYLSICGKNDIVINSKLNKLTKSMLNHTIISRLEFEQEVFKIMLKKIRFNKDVSHYLLQKIIKDALDIKPSSKHTQTLIGILKNDRELNDCVNIEPYYGLHSKNIVDWYCFFLSFSMRSPELGKAINITQLDRATIHELQSLSTDKAEWRDIKTLYNVKSINSIAIGDHVYSISRPLSDDDIYDKIISETAYPDKSAEISARRMQAIGRIHSNRNDFFIKFSTAYDSRDSETIKDIMNVKSIPLENNDMFVTPFYISINKEISGKCTRLTNGNAIDNWLRHLERFSDFGSSGYKKNDNNPYKLMYKDIYANSKELKKKDYKTLNFGLSRLLLSFNIVFETYDNKYFTLPVPAEYVDLSYSYAGDYKVLLYERYDGYLLFNGLVAQPDIMFLLQEYKKLVSEYENNDNYNPIILNGLKELNYDAVKDDPVIDGKMQSILAIITSKYTGIVAQIANSVDDIDSTYVQRVFNIGNIFKIIKYYTFYDLDTARELSNKTLYFPKLSTFILDLYTILFADTTYPWSDIKYIKRLQRFIFFVFIENLRNSGNVSVLLDEMGININRRQIYDDDSYSLHNSLLRADNFFNYRTNYIVDKNDITEKNGYIESASSIDRFMFSYHLLDFFDIYKISGNYMRCDFIVYDDGNYFLVKIAEDEPQNIEHIREAIRSRRNYRIVKDADDEFIRELAKYIEIVINVREKLLITIYNYIYDKIKETPDNLNIIKSDPNHMILNIYEGDIDKILSVI